MIRFSLPIDDVLLRLHQYLAQAPSAVLQAPPGAGKTTGVPLSLLEAAWRGDGTIIMLEPRRLAARAAARRMAQLLGENVGDTVGYRVRHDNKTGPSTRIEVVTEGIFVRRLQQDPALDGVAMVIFDEFHERNLDSDLGLVLALESQAALRPDLKILVMSATLDGTAVSVLMNNAPIVTSEGRSHPVETRYLAKPVSGQIEPEIVRTILQALDQEDGNILTFLPGVAEIRRVEHLLATSYLPENVRIAPLYGNLSSIAQDQAIAPPPAGVRKIVLATSIAETSLTIEGIRIVVDSGLMRVPRFDPQSGMNRLVTIKVSQASADQRRGRAGRLEAGVCFRLWIKASHKALVPFSNPEILDADLAPLSLELANWGVANATTLHWLTPPPDAALAQARDLLVRLGALVRQNGQITAHGKAMARLPLHPRLAHLVLKSAEVGCLTEGARIAALLEERPIVKNTGGFAETDIHFQLRILGEFAMGKKRRRDNDGINVAACEMILRAARQIERLVVNKPGPRPYDGGLTGLFVAFAYPDRIAQRRKGSVSDYILSGGRGATLDPADGLAQNEFLAVASLGGKMASARIFSAATLDKNLLEDCFGGDIIEETVIRWDARTDTAIARNRHRLGELVLKDAAYDATPDELSSAVVQGIQLLGLECLPWTDTLHNWRHRVQFVRKLEPDNGWPDVSDSHLVATLESWLAPFLINITRKSQFNRIALSDALYAMLDWNQQQALDRLAPTHVTVPSGSSIRIDYLAGDVPALPVKLQEMFGAVETPMIGGGRVPLLLHLLSPARRPLQVTRDLGGFWHGSYQQVKAEMKGRYPKHNWPDNPLEAQPTNRTKRFKHRTSGSLKGL